MSKIIYIALQIMGLSNKTLRDIIEFIPDKELGRIFKEDITELQFKYNIELNLYSELFKNVKFVKDSINKANEIMDINKRLGIKTILINNKFYPKNLKKINNAPAILYIKGSSIKKSDEKAVACVGTRTPTIFGQKAAKSIVSKLAKENFVIVSGLACGIDTESHNSCLNVNGKTIAVLAHGLDMIYPNENILLAEKILNQGGTLVSEYPVGIKPDKFRFVARNRIVSGLSKGTIVFETKEKSGTMHTVNDTLSQNKKVFCPVPLRRELQTSGLIKLLDERKAIGIRTKDDYDLIVSELGYKIVNDKYKMDEIKSRIISTMINNSNFNLEDLNNIKQKEINGKGSFGVNKKTYSKFKQILKENNLTVKEFLNGVVFSVINTDGKGK